MQVEIINPLTGQKDLKAADKVRSDIIIDLYRDQVGIDVARFFSDLAEVLVLQCPVTGYRFFYPESLCGDEKFYIDMQVLYEKSGKSYYRDGEFDHRFAFEKIPEGSKVLEIGIGNGSFMKSVSMKVAEIAGLELNTRVAESCRKEGLEVYNEMIELHSQKRQSYYDVVCSFQVLEHVYKVKEFIQGALMALKPGGEFIMSVPNNEPYHMRYNKYETLNMPPHHIGLWEEKSLKNLEKLFNIKLKQTVYCAPHNLRADAFLRAKSWIGSKSLIQNLSLAEKIKIGLLLPVSLPISLVDRMRGRIRGSQICVLFKKLA